MPTLAQAPPQEAGAPTVQHKAAPRPELDPAGITPPAPELEPTQAPSNEGSGAGEIAEHNTMVASSPVQSLAGPLRAASAAVATTVSPAQPHVSKGRKPRLCVVLHGKRADEADVRQAVKDVRAAGYTVDVKVTWEEGDVEKHVADIVRGRKVDTIVAAGGDGTLNEVVAALLSLRVPRSAVSVALMPVGTSNDFAAVTALPKDLSSALLLAADPSARRPVDVGLLNRGVFMNTSTLGASSELGAETTHDEKRLLGPAAYLLKGVVRLTQYTATPVVLRYPAEGEQPHAPRSKQKVVEVREDLLNLTAGNARQVASMLQPCPDALLDDGLLDVTYVIGNPGQASSGLMGEVASKGLDGAAPENIRMMRVPWLEVESLNGPLTANRDGEPVEPSLKFLFETVPRRILLHVPPEGRGVLTEGADGAVNAPTIKHNRLRPGVVKEMFAKVTRFGRVIPGDMPWWAKAGRRALKAAVWVGLGYGAAMYMHAPIRKAREEEATRKKAGGGKEEGGSKRSETRAGRLASRVRRLVRVAV